MVDTFTLHVDGFAGDAAHRKVALAHARTLGWPQPRLEAWHFTNPAALNKAGLAPADGTVKAAVPVAPFAGPRLVFVDGRFRPDASLTAGLPAGVMLLNLSDALAREAALLVPHLDSTGARALLALNAAYAADGLVLVVPAGVRLAVPVQVLHLGASASAAHLRHVAILGEGASASLFETYTGPGAGWTNAATDVVLAPGAALRHAVWQDEAVEAFHTGVARARVEAGASYSSFVLQTGARLARREIDAVLAGMGASCRLAGASLGRGKQHLDNTTVIEHRAAGGTSEEHYRGVFDDAAKGIFQGSIVVKPDAQKTNAHQLNENILLSDRAEAHSKPELEIHADDVKCGHGATAGELDEQALFYLRARGIGREAAHAMLIEAFVSALVDGVEDEAVRVALADGVSRWLVQAPAAVRAA